MQKNELGAIRRPSDFMKLPDDRKKEFLAHKIDMELRKRIVSAVHESCRKREVVGGDLYMGEKLLERPLYNFHKYNTKLSRESAISLINLAKAGMDIDEMENGRAYLADLTVTFGRMKLVPTFSDELGSAIAWGVISSVSGNSREEESLLVAMERHGSDLYFDPVPYDLKYPLLMENFSVKAASFLTELNCPDLGEVRKYLRLERNGSFAQFIIFGEGFGHEYFTSPENLLHFIFYPEGETIRMDLVEGMKNGGLKYTAKMFSFSIS